MSKKSKAVWVEVAPGRKKLFIGEQAEAIRKLPRHTNKTMYSLSVHPDQAKDFQAEAVKAGFKGVTFTPDGKCHVDGRREQAEYAYFRKQYVNLDGGYAETLRSSRMRDLDRAAGRS